jgi:Flp pilus assembly protein TadB
VRGAGGDVEAFKSYEQSENMGLEEIIEAIFGIFIVLALASVFAQVLLTINPLMVIIFILAVIFIIIGIVREIR